VPAQRWLRVSDRLVGEVGEVVGDGRVADEAQGFLVAALLVMRIGTRWVISLLF